LIKKTAFVRDFVHNVAVLDLSIGKVKKVGKFPFWVAVRGNS